MRPPAAGVAELQEKLVIIPPSPENIALAAAELRAGKLVAFPTETVYGLGANAFDESAVKKIFKLKDRPPTNPLIVHLASVAQIDDVSTFEDFPQVRHRLKKLSVLWPGALSVVLPGSRLPLAVTAGLHTVSVRIPNHAIALALIEKAGVPVAAPSANKSNYISPTTAQHVVDEFSAESPLVLDGGPCMVGLESTIISIVEAVPVLLRKGKFSRIELEKILGEKISDRTGVEQSNAAAMSAPGMFKKHYSPRTPLVFWGAHSSVVSDNKALILFSKREAGIDPSFKKILTLSGEGNFEEIASKLFASLRELDSGRFDLIVVDTCADEGLGSAIMDRLRRAKEQ